ncbi:MAG: QueT transporter family protein [Defluviitaleaceae bacterium]|nr:QueT transporter family protein [Defluviitaleaceae bacterium]
MKISVRAMVYVALVAAVYAVVTSMQYTIGFGAIQIRVAESLNLLAFFNPIFVPAVTLGVFLTNLLWSPFGLIDVGLGTLATVISLGLIRITKKTTNNLGLAAVWPVVVNALMIPIVIIYGGGGFDGGFSWATYWTFAGLVGAGQFIAIIIIGYVLFRVLMAKFPHFIKIIEEI